jgi:hypothetical protein
MEPARRGIMQLPKIGDPFSSSSHKWAGADMIISLLVNITGECYLFASLFFVIEPDANRQGEQESKTYSPYCPMWNEIRLNQHEYNDWNDKIHFLPNVQQWREQKF